MALHSALSLLKTINGRTSHGCVRRYLSPHPLLCRILDAKWLVGCGQGSEFRSRHSHHIDSTKNNKLSCEYNFHVRDAWHWHPNGKRWRQKTPESRYMYHFMCGYVVRAYACLPVCLLYGRISEFICINDNAALCRFASTRLGSSASRVDTYKFECRKHVIHQLGKMKWTQRYW